MENATLLYTLALSEMLKQIQWGVHNGPITKNGVFPGISLAF